MADAREASVPQAMDGSETVGNSAGSASAVATVNVDGNTNPPVEQKKKGRRANTNTITPGGRAQVRGRQMFAKGRRSRCGIWMYLGRWTAALEEYL
jgi:hypothetical protein